MVYECIICMENLESPAPGVSPEFRPLTRRACKPEDLKEVCATTACGHVFHRVCLNQWFTKTGKKTCPSCRIPLTGGEIFRIYPTGSVEDTNSGNNHALQMTEIKKCIQICEAHKILIDDYDNLLENFAKKSTYAALLAEQNASLEEECNRLQHTHNGLIPSMINVCEHIFNWIKFFIRFVIVAFRNLIFFLVSTFFIIFVGIFVFQFFRFVQLKNDENMSITNIVETPVYESGTELSSLVFDRN